MKIRPVAVELLHVAGQTDRHDEESSRFLQFSKAPKHNQLILLRERCYFCEI